MSNFKRAVRTSLLFLLVLALFSAGIMEAFFAGENYYYQDARERNELSGTLDYLVCGASHAMRGFRPDILDEALDVNSYNLSCSRLTMQGRYELLQLELNRNPVKTVVLELSYDSLTRNRDEEGPEGDLYMLGKLDSFSDRLSYFFSAIRPSEYGRLYYNYIDNGMNCLKKLIRGTWTDQNKKLMKGYAAFIKENMKFDQELQKIYHTKAFDETIYDENMAYLEKIIALCSEKDIRLILVTTPLSQVTVCRYSNLDTFRSWYAAIAEENGLAFYDFNLLKTKGELLPDATAFADKYHLSNSGAETFSELFTEVVRMAESGEDPSSLFYGNYQEMESHMDLTSD